MTGGVDILIPTVYPEGVPESAALSSFMREAEALDFGGLWVIERLFHREPVLDAYTTLTWAAAQTRRVRLGTGVLLLPLRNPALLAKQVATLDLLSGGRVTLGVSLGGGEAEHATLRAPFRQRARRLEEGVEVLRRLFATSDVSFNGRHYELREATVAPRPLQGADLPVWLGASSEPGLQRVARIADGWLAGGGGSPEQFALNWRRLQNFARHVGRDPAALHNGKLFYIWVDPDRDVARRRVERLVRAYYGPRYSLDDAIFGSAEECAARLRQYRAAGVQTLILGPAALAPEQLERITGIVPLLA